MATINQVGDKWRMEETGPDYTKLGKSVYYRVTDVREWIEANVVTVKRV